MKALHAALLTLAMVGTATATNGASPDYGELPKVTINGKPSEKDTPKEVSSSKKIDGLIAALPKKNRHRYAPKGQRYVGLFVNSSDAEKYEQNKLDRWGRRPEDTTSKDTVTVCFDVLDHWELKQSRRSWSRQLEQWPQIRSAARGSEAAKEYPDQQKPRAFRLERLALDDHSATLHLLEGWFDPVSLGARQTASYEAKYKRVATGPTGIQVFAARDEEAGTVEFIVFQPLLEKKRMSAVGSHMNVRRAGDHASSDCGHARVSLRTAPGSGEHGSVRLDVIVPDDETTKKSAKKKRPPADAKKPPPNAQGELKEIRIRSLVVHMGVSQGVKEKKPTISVAFGWRGRERRTQIFE